MSERRPRVALAIKAVRAHAPFISSFYLGELNKATDWALRVRLLKWVWIHREQYQRLSPVLQQKISDFIWNDGLSYAEKIALHHICRFIFHHRPDDNDTDSQNLNLDQMDQYDLRVAFNRKATALRQRHTSDFMAIFNESYNLWKRAWEDSEYKEFSLLYVRTSISWCYGLKTGSLSIILGQNLFGGGCTTIKPNMTKRLQHGSRYNNNCSVMSRPL